MNTEIKFRVWSIYNEKFIPINPYNENYYSNLSYDLSYFLKRPDFYILQQFIGLNDKKGNAIYEGDIVEITVPKFFMEGGGSYRGIVKYMPPAYYIHIEQKMFTVGDQPNYHFASGFKDCIVVGNVLENKND